MEDARPDGCDMSAETFTKALGLANRLEAGSPLRVISLSGGEPTLHPKLIPFIEEASLQADVVMVLSNGSFVAWEDDKILELLRTEATIQVTCDPRLYSNPLPRIVKAPGVEYIRELQQLFPMGRAKDLENPGLPWQRWPSCFNLRSAVRGGYSIVEAVALLRGRLNKWCTPSISCDGSLVAGECRYCTGIGNVTWHLDEIEAAVRDMRCGRCGLRSNLTPEQSRAVGETTLFVPGE
jgi:hypothetical protein